MFQKNRIKHRLRMSLCCVVSGTMIFISALAWSVMASPQSEIDSVIFQDEEGADAGSACGVSIPDSHPASSLEYVPEVNYDDVVSAFYEICESQEARLFVNNNAYPGITVFHDGELYVSAEEFMLYLDPSSETISEETAVSINTSALCFSAEYGARFSVANGRYLWCRSGVCKDLGALTVPVSVLADALGMKLSFDGADYYVSGEKSAIASANDYYDPDDVYWLSRIISSESRSEPLYGKIAVGNVVLNRVASSDFPDDIYGVIFDTRFGVQFSPIVGGAIYSAPDEESILAAKLCLEGVSLSDDILYFMNPELSSTTWISDNRAFVMTIGNHTFYS